MPKRSKIAKKIKRDLKRGRGQGKLERGAIFVVIILVSLIFAGYLLVGGELPTKLHKPSDKLVMVGKIKSEPARSNLQMYTFWGTTLTPVPPPPPNVPLPSGVDQTAMADAECTGSVSGVNASQMIWAYLVGSTPASGNQMAIQVFYKDATTMLLGSGTVSQMKKYPTDHVSNPNVGNATAKDANGLPFYPAVFLTDITTTATDTSGDAKSGGLAQPPSDVYGAWKPAGGIDPSVPNVINLGTGSDAWPPANGPGNAGDSGGQQWSAQVLWKTAGLKTKAGPLVAKHKYRAEIILHNGNALGDAGRVCLTFTLP